MTIAEIVKNKELLIAQKKAAVKYADACYGVVAGVAGVANKSVIDTNDIDAIDVKIAINTTNILDSHGDVHIKNLWNKSLKENKMIMHIQEHKMAFDKIISSGKDLKASAKDMSFKELGYKMEGDTQVLLFESTVKRERNTFMFKQYANGNVVNHSVGMIYVKLFLAVNDDKYEEEKKVWDKYYPTIANKEAADDLGYFWAVTEAKVIEGSAVPIGSNQLTPTIEITEAAKSTSQIIEPSDDTQRVRDFFNHLNI